MNTITQNEHDKFQNSFIRIINIGWLLFGLIIIGWVWIMCAREIGLTLDINGKLSTALTLKYSKKIESMGIHYIKSGSKVQRNQTGGVRVYDNHSWVYQDPLFSFEYSSRQDTPVFHFYQTDDGWVLRYDADYGAGYDSNLKALEKVMDVAITKYDIFQKNIVTWAEDH